MRDFNWVGARGACSAAKVFEILKGEIERDIEIRNELRAENPPYYKFCAQIEGENIVVIREGNRIGSSVKFTVEGEKIIVLNTDRKKMLEAALTINSEGECKLKIGGEEYDSWHLRKLALEDLFFGDF